MDEDSDDDVKLVYDDDDLTWDVVARATGVDDPIYHTRISTNASSSRGGLYSQGLEH
ncbi:hypothetical protein COCNU_scaffold001541G000010 [Cocos nucifera]|nr:hypothetical protein [Cocos nucifera]